MLLFSPSAPRKPILIPPKGVVTRLSTNILAMPDLAIARAVRFIWDHYQEPIGVPEVAAAAGLNRRKLERLFPQMRIYFHKVENVFIQNAKTFEFFLPP